MFKMVVEITELLINFIITDVHRENKDKMSILTISCFLLLDEVVSFCQYISGPIEQKSDKTKGNNIVEICWAQTQGQVNVEMNQRR